ncbi:MAG: ATP-binding protein [Anaerolineae bacterium]
MNAVNGTPDLLNLFNEPAVRLLYYMVLIAVSCAALFMALGQRMRGPNERGAGRYAVSAFGVLWAWAALMVGALVVIVTRNAQILPPLDRAVNAMVILLVGYSFLTADRLSRRVLKRPEDTRPITVATNTPGATLLALVAAVGIIASFVVTTARWTTQSLAVEFNLSPLSTFWVVGTIVLLVVIAVALIVQFRQVLDAPLKLIFTILLLIGYGYSLFNRPDGDELGAVKLAFLAAVPIFAVVIYRFVILRLGMILQEKVSQAADAAQQATMSAIISDKESERDAVGVLRALGQMLEREDPEDLPQQVVMSIASAMKADVVAMLVIDDAEYADVLAAYDSVQHRPIAAMALKLDEQPTFREAVDRRAQRILTAEKQLNELVDLYTRLDIQKVGPAYLQPMLRDGVAVGMLVIALPYTARSLRDSDMRLLDSIAPIAARLLLISRAAYRKRQEQEEKSIRAIVQNAEDTSSMTGVGLEMPVSAARQEMQASLELARLQINELTSTVRDLQIELDYERSRMAELSGDDPEHLTITQRLEAMASERSTLESERERLMQALQEAQAQLATVTGDDQDVYQAMLRMVQQERDELQAQKDKLETEISEIRARGTGETPTLMRDMLTRMSEERARLSVERDSIKQQLSSIEGEMTALGIEGGSAGLAQTIMKLTDERGYYKAQAEKAQQERDALLAERQRLGNEFVGEGQRDRVAAMELEMKRLASDREALVKQRDAVRNERDSLAMDRTRWEALRTKMVAEMAGLQSDLEEAVFERNRVVTERNKLAQERAALLSDRDRSNAERTALQAERDQLLARVEGNRESLQQLGEDGVGALTAMIDELTEERSELEHQLLRMQTEIQNLKDALDDAEDRLKHSIAVPTSASIDSSTAEVMLSIAQELRTPMSSIGAYVDLLLGESVGILGALQKQFLTRVKANTDRLATLIEDFIKVTAIDTGTLSLKPERVDMDEVINDAITATKSQFREKNITLKLDVHDDLPHIKGDRDALQQIVIQLLSNAYLASPVEGEVVLGAKMERNQRIGSTGSSDVISVWVRDFGGGIPPEEQSRVFSRLYRADNPLIQGLGDTGVGLSIARALTEMHRGKIWLESVRGVSSTFRLMIPVEGVDMGNEPAQLVADDQAEKVADR